MEDRTYVFLDVETTGLSPYRDAIIQLSAIKYVGREPTEAFDSYVNPLRPIPPESTNVNGITDDMVASAPTIDQLQGPFLDFASGAVLVGYNVGFDLAFLNHTFQGAFVGAPYLDVLGYARDLLFLPNYRLETVATSIGFHPDGDFHDSLADCQATAAVFYHLGLTEAAETPRVYHPGPSRSRPHPHHVERTVSDAELDLAHPFFGKKIVFTGELSISRDEAQQYAVNVGAAIRNAVTSKTDYLVVGAQDTTIVGADGMSAKQRKAQALNRAGKANIAILSERDFLAICPVEK
jgi:DNA polymerase III epsilon subunit family exonuclease